MQSAVRLSSEQLLELQKEQYLHDQRNHFDILSLHKADRLKHYGLHYAKYVGRLARGEEEAKSYSQTLVDSFLVCLSAANTLHQRLDDHETKDTSHDFLRVYADAAGRFADACEKIDHLEDFVQMAKRANLDICACIIEEAASSQTDIYNDILLMRRDVLGDRHFYIDDAFIPRRHL